MNPYDNDPRNDEAFDLDGLLDDAFASRRVPVLSPSLMDVRRRARQRRNRTRATSLAAVACVGVGGVAVLVNNHRPALRSAVGAGELGGEQSCVAESVVPTTTILESVVPTTTILEPVVPLSTVLLTAPPTTILETTTLPPASTTALAAGFAASPTFSTVGELVTTTTTTCPPQPSSGFRCIGDPTVTQDGWAYYDHCETLDVAVPTSYEMITAPPTTQAVVSIGSGDYLAGIAEQYCVSAEAIATYNGWPDGVDHVLLVGDVIVLPPSSYCAGPPASPPIAATATTEVLATTTTAPNPTGS